MDRRRRLATGLIVLAGCVTLVGCATTVTAPSVPVSSSRPASVSPAASITPARPSPSSGLADLHMSVRVLEQCGSEGGCAYFADLTDDRGRRSTERLDAGSTAPSSPPRRLAVGAYSVIFRSSLVSDVTFNGSPPAETPDATCTTTFDVVPGQTLVEAQAVFHADACEILISMSQPGYGN